MKDCLTMLSSYKMEAYSNCIFDYDNTICRIPINWKLERTKFKQFAFNKFCFRFQDSLTVEEMEKELLKKFPKKANLVYLFRSNLEDNHKNDHILNKNILSEITIGRNNFIVSNNLTETVFSGLKLYKLDHFFKEVIGVDFSFSPKPYMDSWLYLKNKYSLLESNTIMYGDNPLTDGLFAKNANIVFSNIMFNPK